MRLGKSESLPASRSAGTGGGPRCGCFPHKQYEVSPLVCPRCQKEMRFVAAIENPEVIRRILEHLGLCLPVRARTQTGLANARPTPRAHSPPGLRPLPEDSYSQLPALQEEDYSQVPLRTGTVDFSGRHDASFLLSHPSVQFLDARPGFPAFSI